MMLLTETKPPKASDYENAFDGRYFVFNIKTQKEEFSSDSLFKCKEYKKGQGNGKHLLIEDTMLEKIVG